MPSLPRPKPNTSTTGLLAGATKELAKGGYKVGQLTSEIQRLRRALDSKDGD